MIIRPRAIATTVIAVLVAAGPSACGSEQQPPSTATVGEPTGFRDLPAEEILHLAAEDMRTAHSWRFNGSTLLEDQWVTLDLAVDEHGNCAGRIKDEIADGEIISGPDGTFIRGDEGLWEQASPGDGEAILARLGDRWAKVSDGADGNNFIAWCSLRFLAKALAEALESHDGDAEKSQAALIDGQSALRVTGDGGRSYVWVAVESPHYILWVQQVGDPGESMKFLDYDDPVDTSAPLEDEYVDFSAMDA